MSPLLTSFLLQVPSAWPTARHMTPRSEATLSLRRTRRSTQTSTLCTSTQSSSRNRKPSIPRGSSLVAGSTGRRRYPSCPSPSVRTRGACANRHTVVPWTRCLDGALDSHWIQGSKGGRASPPIPMPQEWNFQKLFIFWGAHLLQRENVSRVVNKTHRQNPDT